MLNQSISKPIDLVWHFHLILGALHDQSTDNICKKSGLVWSGTKRDTMVADTMVVCTDSLWEHTIALPNSTIVIPYELPFPKTG